MIIKKLTDNTHNDYCVFYLAFNNTKNILANYLRGFIWLFSDFIVAFQNSGTYRNIAEHRDIVEHCKPKGHTGTLLKSGTYWNIAKLRDIQEHWKT